MSSPAPPVQQDSPVAELAAVSTVLAAAEVAISSFMIAAYAKWLAEVAAKVLGGFVAFAIAPDPTAVWASVPTWERLVDQLIDRLAQIARAGWINASRQLGVDLPWNADDPILADQLQRTRNLMVRTPDEVYKMIIDVLGRTISTGGTVEDQVRGVRHILDITGVENWPSRARTVAVTEVHRAWNFGALAASMRIQRSEPTQDVLKRWDARDDSRTRFAHDQADGQIVPIYQPFIVNMEPLMAPGDPAGSPGNVINCRCKPLFSRRNS